MDTASDVVYRPTVRLGLILGWCALAALPRLAFAAHSTRVLTAAEESHPLPELHLGVRLERTELTGKITREWFEGQSALDVRELDYVETTQALTLTARVGLFRDLELTVAAPIVLSYVSEIGFADGVGPNSTVYAPATADRSSTNADDPAFSTRFPITEVPGRRERGGFGDMRFGLGWSPVNDLKAEAWPTLTLRAEITAPTGEVWDPADADAVPGGADGKIGRGLTVFDLSLGLSRRTRPAPPHLEPFFLIGTRLPIAIGAQQARGMTPPPTARVEAGTELVLYDRDRARYAFELGVVLQYIASGRTYSPLSDYLPNYDQTRTRGDLVTYDDFANPSNYRNGGREGVSCAGVRLDRNTGAQVPATPGVGCGEFNQVDEHVRLGGRFAAHLQPTAFTLFRVGVDISYIGDHLITNERVGTDTDPSDSTATCGSGPCAGRVNAANANGEDERSGFYDPRYDAPGRRFRLEEAFTWTVFADVSATF